MSDAAARTFDSLRSRPKTPNLDLARITGAFQRLGATEDGQVVLAYLRQVTIETVLPPEASDSALREIEAQRRLVRKIEGMIASGG